MQLPNQRILVGSMLVLAGSAWMLVRFNREAQSLKQKIALLFSEEDIHEQSTQKGKEEDSNKKKDDTLVGSVSFHERHVIIGTGCTSWESHVEKDPAHVIVGLLHRSIKERCQQMNDDEDKLFTPVNVKLTASDEPAGRIHIFPDGVCFDGLSEVDIDGIVTAICSPYPLASPPPGCSSLNQIEQEGAIVYVCAHGARDERCGQRGPIIKDMLLSELKNCMSQDLPSTQVFATSHVGGHKWAANVIIFMFHRFHSRSQSLLEKPSSLLCGGTSGDWYGSVHSKADVSEIVNSHICRGNVVTRMWRGRLGLTSDEQHSLLSAYKDELNKDCSGVCTDCSSKNTKDDRKKVETW